MPATVAMPTVMKANNSLLVSFFRYGRIHIGAESIPKIILAADPNPSAPPTPKVFLNKLLYSEINESRNVMTQASMYKRSALLAVGGFREELDYFSDSFVQRAIGLKYGACFIPDPCLMFRVFSNSVTSRCLNDDRKMLDIISRVSWLMRSPEFRDIFPKKYVDQWEQYCREATISKIVTRFQNGLADTKMMFSKYRFSGRPMDQAMSVLFAKALGSLGTIISLWLRSTVSRYKGDARSYYQK